MFVADGKVIPVDSPFTLGDLQYPANWLRLATEEQKAAAGISWVPDPEPYDGRFYWGRDNAGSLIPKRLEDEPAVDENDDPILDADGEQVINKGLKSQFIAEQKQIAGTLLAPTDWYITRQFETSVEVPAAVLDYRAAVRTTCDVREVEIASVVSTAELAALMTNPAKVYDKATDSMVANTAPFIPPWPETER